MNTTGTGDLAALRRQVQGLRTAMRSRAVIEQAVGIMAAVHGTDPDRAFDRLVRLSQQRNLKLRRLAAVLVELTAETGPGTAADIVHQLDGADPLIDLAGERNHKRTPGPDELLPATVIEAAGELVAAQTEPSPGAHLDNRVRQARIRLYTELIQLGWVPPSAIPAEISCALDDYPVMSDPDENEDDQR